MSNPDKMNTYQKAKTRVKEEKTFYSHVGVYIIINLVITIVILNLKHYIYDGYLIMNLLSTPVIWGIFLLGHGIWVFRKGKKIKWWNPFKKWEERKIQELIAKDEDINSKINE